MRPAARPSSSGSDFRPILTSQIGFPLKVSSEITSHSASPSPFALRSAGGGFIITDSSNARDRAALVVRPKTCPTSTSRLAQPLVRALAHGSPGESGQRKSRVEADALSRDTRGADSSEELLKTAEEEINHLERVANADALRADGRFNFNNLRQDLALEGLGNLTRSYSSSSIGRHLLSHRQHAVNIRRAQQRPAVGPSLLRHGVAIAEDDLDKSAHHTSRDPSKNAHDFVSGYNRYVLATSALSMGQGVGSECSKKARAMHGHLHSLECIVPMLPPPHASVMSQSLNLLRAHVFAAVDSHKNSAERDSSANDDASMMLYSDLCCQLKDDRDDLFACLTQEQQARKEAQQELFATREELSSVKDQLEFARRAIKAFQSSKTTTKEALYFKGFVRAVQKIELLEEERNEREVSPKQRNEQDLQERLQSLLQHAKRLDEELLKANQKNAKLEEELEVLRRKK